MDHDHIHVGGKSWKLIARTVSPTSSLFLAKRSFTYTPRGTWRNFGKTRGGVGKSGVLEHKNSNRPISETRYAYRPRGKVRPTVEDL